MNSASPARAWNRFWFAPETPHALARFRVAFFGFLFVYYAGFDRDIWLWAELPDEHWLPVGVWQLFDGPPLQPWAVRWIERAWEAALLLAALGLWTRSTTLVSACLGYALFAYRSSFGESSHDDLGIVAYLIVWAGAPAGDALSLDRWLFRRGRAAPAPDGRYRWRMRLMAALFGAVFLGAGVSKLVTGGGEWLTSDTTRNVFLYAHHGNVIDAMARDTGIALWLAAHPLLCKLGAVAALTAELAAPLAIVSRWARIVVVPGLALLQLGFHFTSSAGFLNMFALYLVWLPWSTLGNNDRTGK